MREGGAVMGRVVHALLKKSRKQRGGLGSHRAAQQKQAAAQHLQVPPRGLGVCLFFGGEMVGR